MFLYLHMHIEFHKDRTNNKNFFQMVSGTLKAVTEWIEVLED